MKSERVMSRAGYDWDSAGQRWVKRTTGHNPARGISSTSASNRRDADRLAERWLSGYEKTTLKASTMEADVNAHGLGTALEAMETVDQKNAMVASYLYGVLLGLGYEFDVPQHRRVARSDAKLDILHGWRFGRAEAGANIVSLRVFSRFDWPPGTVVKVARKSDLTPAIVEAVMRQARSSDEFPEQPFSHRVWDPYRRLLVSNAVSYGTPTAEEKKELEKLTKTLERIAPKSR